MAKWQTLTDYNNQAGDYDTMRNPGAEVVAFLTGVFNRARSKGKILSIGCGTGQYEKAVFKGQGVVGLDLSQGMLDIATSRIAEVVCGDMVSLPFPDSNFSGAYFVQSLHHVGANTTTPQRERDILRLKAIAEAVRVVKSGPVAIVQRDPEQNMAVWFWTYFPNALRIKLEIQPRIAQVCEWMKCAGLKSVIAKPLDDPMIKDFYKPTAPLDPTFRRSFSEFSYLKDEEISIGLKQLNSDIKSGKVTELIENCRHRFKEMGGTVFGVSGIKETKE